MRSKTMAVAALAGALALLLLWGEGALADVIHLKKGGKIRGVVISESEGSIEIRSSLGTIVLSRGAIAGIEKMSKEDNRALESQWRKEKEQVEDKVKEEKKFEEEQRAKGLVHYKGAWIPVEKMYEIEKGIEKDGRELQKTIEDQKQSLEEMEKRLNDMEARLDRRERELNYREQQLALREQNLLLQQQNIQRQAEQVAREKEVTPPKIFAVPRIEVVPPRSK